MTENDTARCARCGRTEQQAIDEDDMRLMDELHVTPTSTKARENRLRRMAQRQGYLLVKSRRRDRYAPDFGLYVVVGDSRGNRVGRYGGLAAISAFDRGEGMTLDEVEALMTTPWMSH